MNQSLRDKPFQRYLAGLLLALLLHGVLIPLRRLIPESVSPQGKKLKTLSVRVNIASVKTKAPPPQRVTARVRQTPANIDEKMEKKFDYQSLFPAYEHRAGNEVYVARKSSEDQVLDTSDPANLEKQGDVGAFAKEFADYFQIPESVQEILIAGSAVAVIKRVAPGTYAISKVTGEPYMRALLFERLKEFLEKSVGKEFLERGDVRVFRLNTVFSKEKTTLPKEIRTRIASDINGVTLEIKRLEPHEGWDLAIPNPAGGVSLNIISTALFIYEKWFAENPEQTDSDLRDLRRSPAFSAPIR